MFDLAGAQDTLERSLVLIGKRPFAANLLRELDVELDVKVAEVVMSVRGHTLAADNLDGAFCNVSFANG